MSVDDILFNDKMRRLVLSVYDDVSKNDTPSTIMTVATITSYRQLLETYLKAHTCRPNNGK